MSLRAMSTEAALQELRRTGVLVDVRVQEPLSLRPLCDGDALSRPVLLNGCVLAGLDATCIAFECPVLLSDCQVGREGFYAAYFLAGLTMIGCRFAGAVDFQCGGHNQNGTIVRIAGTTFEDFVNFFDCWYEGPFTLHGCTFKKGTNLLGNKGRPYEVRFDVAPDISGNVGDVDRDGEGAA